MFTGIIENLGEIKKIDKYEDYWKFSVSTNFSDIKLGDSISINGVCLTVTKINGKQLDFEVVSETLIKSNFKSVKEGDVVNLERSLKLNDRLDGHLVQGHVEDTGKILSKVTNEGETKIKIEINKDIIKYCIYKGSIAVDGISLTISKIYSNSIEICIIPYTLKHTTLGIKDTGSLVNIETDMISKYVERRAQFNS